MKIADHLSNADAIRAKAAEAAKASAGVEGQRQQLRAAQESLIRERERLLMPRGCGFFLNGTTVSGRSVHVV